MLNVLYVEDDAGSRGVLKMVQRMNPGFMEVVMFADSQDFEQKLLALDPQPDLILLDIHMKPHTGFDMFRMIRLHPQYDSIPVMALTASVMNEEVRMLEEAGFHGVLSKPLDMDFFTSVIERVMNGERVWYVW
jgi:CheY-like chemotaxis protein